MTRPTQTSIALLVLLAAAVAAYWLLQKTTPERIGSLVFFILVGAYAITMRRNDVIGAAIVFFMVLNSNFIMFDHYFPYWVGILMALAGAFAVWVIIFKRSGWLLAVAGAIALVELSLAIQYSNLTFPAQAFLVASPFILLLQRHSPSTEDTVDMA